MNPDAALAWFSALFIALTLFSAFGGRVLAWIRWKRNKETR